MNYSKGKNGFGMLEIVIGAALISVSLFGVVAVSSASLKATENATHSIQAAFLLEEGMEVMRFLRDSGWNTYIAPLNTATPYYLNFSAGAWTTTSSQVLDIDGIFERTFVINDVYRNIDDDIVTSGGTIDPNTKKITFSVSWSLRGITITKTISAYLTNILDN